MLGHFAEHLFPPGKTEDLRRGCLFLIPTGRRWIKLSCYEKPEMNLPSACVACNIISGEDFQTDEESVEEKASLSEKLWNQCLNWKHS